MRYFDLHCDTVSRAYKEKKSLYDGKMQINALKIKNVEDYKQCFALWLDDELKGDAAFSLCKKMLNYYESQMKYIEGKGITNLKGYLTIENAVSLGGDLDNILYFKEKGIKIMSLTWNGENDLASGVYAKGGLKPLGKEAVKEAENCGIVIDVSHLNESGFRDVCRIAKKPFIATHSNCCDICPHKRNLKKWQVKEIISRGGIIGLNFYPPFLGTGKGSAFEKIRENIEYLLSLGGENNIALGSDFDGAEMSAELDSVDKVADLYDYLLSCHIGKGVIDKVFYSNVERLLS